MATTLRPGPLPARPPPPTPPPSPTLYNYTVLAEFVHDATSYTEGLAYEESCPGPGKGCRPIFWESSGLWPYPNGSSTVREVDLATGAVLRRHALPAGEFGEGLAKIGGRLLQLVWQSGKVWSYDAGDLSSVRQLQDPLSDGWGATTNGTHFLVGDSTDVLHFLDPATLAIVRQIEVTDGDFRVKWLNELEWVNGLIYANIYTTDCIAQIDPGSGTVVGWVQMQGLKASMIAALNWTTNSLGNVPDVLNGIAWDAKQSRLFVTGKLWPRLYQIELASRNAAPGADELAAVRAACIVDYNRTLGRR